MSDPAGDVVLEVLLDQRRPADVLREIREGLLRTPREISPKYFYDDHGSELFERICELPEYYQTRTERALLARIADRVVERTCASELVELGSGAATKTRLLLDAMRRHGSLTRFVPFDFSEGMVRRVAAELVREYPGLRVHAVVGDFMQQLGELPPADHGRLVIFLGGTIGNFRHAEAVDFLRTLAARMRSGDFFLLGIDLVKDTARLVAAYDDAAGVTARFNKNALRVLNRMLDGDFDPQAFQHRALYDTRHDWIEMRLVSLQKQRVHLRALDLALELERGEEILTEISAKYDQARVRALLAGSGFDLVEWFTDAEALFALGLACRV